MNEIGIKARLLLMTLIPAGILATAVGAYFSWQHLGDLQQQLLERGQLTAEHLQRPATEALLAGQPESLIPIVEINDGKRCNSKLILNSCL